MSMNKIYLGIDPGDNGGLVWLDADGTILELSLLHTCRCRRIVQCCMFRCGLSFITTYIVVRTGLHTCV